MTADASQIEQRTIRTFTLLDTVIVFLISCSLVIFVFSIAAKFLGQDTFDQLPEYIQNSYAALWSAGVVAGGTLVGAVIDSLSSRTSTKGSFILWVFLTTALLMAFIAGVIGLARILDKPMFTVPYGATPLNIARGNLENGSFHMQNPFGFPQVRLQGTYSVKDYVMTGHISDSELIPAPQAPGIAPTPPFSSIAVHVCYLAVQNGMPILKLRPALPEAHNTGSIAVQQGNAAPVAIPNFDFVVDVHNLDNIAPPYLCAYFNADSSNVHMPVY